jgi:hypothetical protein
MKKRNTMSKNDYNFLFPGEKGSFPGILPRKKLASSLLRFGNAEEPFTAVQVSRHKQGQDNAQPSTSADSSEEKGVTAFPIIAQQTTLLLSATKGREPPAMLPMILTELPTLNVGTVAYTAIDNSDVHTKLNKDNSSAPNGAMNLFSLGDEG